MEIVALRKYRKRQGESYRAETNLIDNDFCLISLDVSAISPNSGSKMGGQTITITGRFFTNTIAHINVTVEGMIKLVLLN